MRPERSKPIIGAILAGGESRRFGSPKAFARVHGLSLLERVSYAVCRAVPEVVVIARKLDLEMRTGFPVRLDRVPGLGPLGGIDAALRFAADRRAGGVLCVSCDMPFLSAALLREIASRGDGVRAVVPESGRGVEPLCAWYPIGARKEVRRLLASDDRSLRALLASVETVRIPVDEVRRFGDPEILFFNVNTREDLERANVIARQIDASS